MDQLAAAVGGPGGGNDRGMARKDGRESVTLSLST